jgi:hypothetical protein
MVGVATARDPFGGGPTFSVGTAPAVAARASRMHTIAASVHRVPAVCRVRLRSRMSGLLVRISGVRLQTTA